MGTASRELRFSRLFWTNLSSCPSASICGGFGEVIDERHSDLAIIDGDKYYLHQKILQLISIGCAIDQAIVPPLLGPRGFTTRTLKFGTWIGSGNVSRKPSRETKAVLLGVIYRTRKLSVLAIPTTSAEFPKVA